MGRPKRDDPAPLIRFQHVDTGWVEEVAEGSVAAERLTTSDDWKRLGNGAGSTEETKVKVSDAAAKLAEELGVDLSEVEGTGKGGSITKGDVEDAAEENGAGSTED